MNNIVLSWDESMVDSFNANPKITFKKLKIFDPEAGRFWGEVELQKVGTITKERKTLKGKNQLKAAKPRQSCDTQSEFCSIISSVSDQVPSAVTKPYQGHPAKEKELKERDIKTEATVKTEYGVESSQAHVASEQSLVTKTVGRPDLAYPLLKTPYEQAQCEIAQEENTQPFQGFERNIYGQFECPYCDRSYNSPATVKGHITRCHVGKFSKYTCTVCRAVKRDLVELQLHLIKSHSIDIRTAAIMSEMCETKSVM